MTNYCESAQVSLSTDDQGRDWEHFWLGQNYVFSNQIRDRQSFSKTNPGEVIYNRALCQWGAQPSPPMAAQTSPAMAPGEGGAMGLLLLVGIIGSGVYAWFTKVKPDWSDDYHPMADVPPLPVAYFNAGAVISAPPEHTQGYTADPLPSEPSSTRHGLSQLNDDRAFSAPWDEPSSTVIDPSSTVIDDTVTGSPYGLDKLKGVSLKQFKDQLARLGITPESGSFKSIELLRYPGTASIIEARLRSFWREFGSTRTPHAIYFVFGLQDGGNRSPEFKEQYEQAKLWVTNWFKEQLPHE
ncbi:MAG: hypothetical protein WBG38_05245 [Nodosilinea sp.]